MMNRGSLQHAGSGSALRRIGAVGAAAAGALVLLTACGAGSTAAPQTTASSSSTGVPAAAVATPRTPARSIPAPSGHLTVVPSVPTRTLPAVALTSVATFQPGVTGRVLTTTSTTTSGQGRGVVSGQPAVTFTLSIHNGSSGAISLDRVQVTATYGAGVPATPVPDDGHQFAGRLPPGGTAQGKYTFAIPTGAHSHVVLSAGYQQDVATVQFAGAVG